MHLRYTNIKPKILKKKKKKKNWQDESEEDEDETEEISSAGAKCF